MLAKDFRNDKLQEAYNFIKPKIISDEVQDACIKYLSEYRNLDYKILRDTCVFYAENDSELEFLTSYEEDFMYYLGFRSKNVDYSDRYLFPIHNGKGNLNAWVGYDYESKSKYLVGMVGLGNKKRLLYGIDDLSMSYEEDTIIVVEGIFDRLRLKEIGLNLGVSLLGKKMSKWQKRYINRFKNKILIPDGDDSGQDMIDQWKEGLTGNIAVIKLEVKEKSLTYPEGIITKVCTDVDDRLREDYDEVKDFNELYKDIIVKFNENNNVSRNIEVKF